MRPEHRVYKRLKDYNYKLYYNPKTSTFKMVSLDRTINKDIIRKISTEFIAKHKDKHFELGQYKPGDILLFKYIDKEQTWHNRICTKCGEIASIKEFNKGPGYLCNYCYSEVTSEASANWRKNNPQLYKKRLIEKKLQRVDSRSPRFYDSLRSIYDLAGGVTKGDSKEDLLDDMKKILKLVLPYINEEDL